MAFAEAEINEFYVDARERSSYLLEVLGFDIVEDIAELWGDIERKETLDKYQLALLFQHSKLPSYKVRWIGALRFGVPKP